MAVTIGSMNGDINYVCKAWLLFVIDKQQQTQPITLPLILYMYMCAGQTFVVDNIPSWILSHVAMHIL